MRPSPPSKDKSVVVLVEQGEAPTGIAEVATASAGVERIQGTKKLEYKQQYDQALYSIKAVNDHHKLMTPEISCNLSRKQRANDGVYFRVIDTSG